MLRTSSEGVDRGDLSPVAAVVLAAGGSTRMGRAKQRLPVRSGGPVSLLQHAARVALESGCDPVVVVLGAGADTLRAELTSLNVVVVENPSWQAGLSTSLRAGVGAALGRFPELSGVLVTLADQPEVDPPALKRLLAAFRESEDRPAASAYAQGVGAPAVLPRRLLPALERLQGDRGARALLAGEAVTAVPLAAAGQDLDTPEDYERFLARTGSDGQ